MGKLIIVKPLVEFNLWMHYLYTIYQMLQNKIYLNFFYEIFKTFLVILFGLSIIALTVRAVNFLDLIVNSGYPVLTYFQYSFLNLFGLAPKFIPLSFFLAISIFITKHLQDNEFIILWTSGIKKIQIVNLFFYISLIISVLYLVFSSLITPYVLNKSRGLLSQDNLNSFLPTIRIQQFSDSFKGFTFLVEKKVGNKIQNIFINDKGNNLKGLSPNISNTNETTIIAESGMIEKNNMFLLNGQIISSKKDNIKNEVITFEQLNIELSDLATTTIKKPKLQETSTLKLVNCFLKNSFNGTICNDQVKEEIIPLLNRRIILPLYIPVITLICSFLLIRRKEFFFKDIFIFSYAFVILLSTELFIRYTGINYLIRITYILLPLILLSLIYFILFLNFSKEVKNE